MIFSQSFFSFFEDVLYQGNCRLFSACRFLLQMNTKCYQMILCVCVCVCVCLCVCVCVRACFLGPQVRHMEVPRLGVELELQLWVYTSTTATWDLSPVCDLHHSSQQRQIHWARSTEQCQGSNLNPHGSWLSSFLLSYNRNSWYQMICLWYFYFLL